jgi:hypothetical protein
LINAKLHVVIAKGYTDECIDDDPQLEACMYVVNLEQAFEAGLQVKTKW